MKSEKFEWVVVALLAITAIGSSVTAYEVVRMAKNGLNVELTTEEAEEVLSAKEVAENDMNDEKEID